MRRNSRSSADPGNLLVTKRVSEKGNAIGRLFPLYVLNQQNFDLDFCMRVYVITIAGRA